MSTSDRRTKLRQHLLDYHPESRVNGYTKPYMERAHEAFHRRDPSLLDDFDHFSEHIDNGWTTKERSNR